MIEERDQTNFPANIDPTFLEQRAFPRWPVEMKVRVSIAGGADIECTTIDLSLGGVALRSDARVLIGQRVIIAFPSVTFVEGTVVRGTSKGFAVTFTPKHAQTRRLTKLLVALLSPHTYTNSKDPNQDPDLSESQTNTKSDEA